MVNSDALNTLIAIARDAGDAVMAHYGCEAVVQLKSDASPVTVADHAAHTVIVDALRSAFPGVRTISGEGDIAPHETRQHWRRFWLVDPLDAAKKFIHRNGEFTINIALIEDGVPMLGFVFAPAMEAPYSAGRGLGSWKNEGDGEGVRLFGPDAPGVDGITSVGSPSHLSAELEVFLATLKVASRLPADSSLKFGLVAEGKAHLYPRLGTTMEWDVAASDCVYRYTTRDGVRSSPLSCDTPTLKQQGFVLGVSS